MTQMRRKSIGWNAAKSFTKFLISALTAAFLFVAVSDAGPTTDKKGKTEDTVTQPVIDSSMSAKDAQHTLASLIQSQWDWDGSLAVSNIQVNEQSLSYELAIKKRSGYGGGGMAGVIGMKDGPRNFSFAQTPYFSVQPKKWGKNLCILPKLESYKKDWLCWTDEHDADLFVAAMNRMIWENSPAGGAQREAEQEAFRKKLAAWQASGAKVDLPEEAQRHEVLAVEAVNEKNFPHAADEYLAGLKIYPTWPQAQYNAAQILGELHRYADAVEHMQMYLLLTPNAPDAQAAKQQIWIWQDKDKNGSN
ncbi:MAG: hypothetical protein WBL70_17730 [Candidatus Acidiferrales bacterium]